MNIIFTRPLLESEDLMTSFFSSGHKVIHVPTLSIKSASMKSIHTEDYEFKIGKSIVILQVLVQRGLAQQGEHQHLVDWTRQHALRIMAQRRHYFPLE